MRRNLAVSPSSCVQNDREVQLTWASQSRHLSIPGAEPFRDPQSQAARFLDPASGEGVFQQSGAKSLWEIRESVIRQEELTRSVASQGVEVAMRKLGRTCRMADIRSVTRISKLEHLDEIEELRLVLSHYCVAWGTKGEGMDGIGL
jgi:[phosphatase 2A protein]-leucine-carboxy methyltransferase